jgi:hypothetical protein
MLPIKGVWKNPTKSRCDVKVAYLSMDIAEVKACSATRRAGQLIIAYECFDCGAFPIGHPDLSQSLAHPKKVMIKTPPICVRVALVALVRIALILDGLPWQSIERIHRQAA